MQKRNAAIVATMLILAGCSSSTSVSGNAATRVGNVPDAVVDLAAPGQNLASARLLPEDGCYWYEHSGPVETTLLPLRTTAGNPICSKPNA
jgi:uncharacterized protein YcfL